MFNSENCWDILDTYFQKGGSPESSNPLVKHQIDSYNKFIDNTVKGIAIPSTLTSIANAENIAKNIAFLKVCF